MSCATLSTADNMNEKIEMEEEELDDDMREVIYGTQTLSLEQLVPAISVVLSKGTKELQHDKIMSLMSRYDANSGDWRRYVFFDKCKYTRNLIATDNQTFTLLLLCWNKGQGSPVHDHPCDGCWVKVIEGCIRETRYENSIGHGPLREMSVGDYGPGAVSYITDYIGIHKMENPDEDAQAITLHLYSPPFSTCKRIDPIKGQVICSGAVTFYSENGYKIEHA
eukprot:GILK01002376.1.p1 GENE.GILK01002376.1~~GILK01002376.1.p1  ORF type:complete len:222 (-),score=28.59 GILK01002376.1:225-890(-)